MSANREYPLAWPPNWPRHENPGDSQFRTTLTRALKNVNDELQRFSNDSGKEIDAILISSNVTLGNQRPEDAGVSCYFTWDGLETCIAVDRYAHVEDNLQAIFHCLGAERTKLRHGGINLVRAAFRGYAMLPAPIAEQHWRDVLEIKPGMSSASRRAHSLSYVEQNYKRLRRRYHPDAGDTGDVAKFDAVQKAWKQYKAQTEGGQ